MTNAVLRRAVLSSAAALALSPLCRAGDYGHELHNLYGESHLLAYVPEPGYPEAVAINKGIVYVTTPANLGIPANNNPSVIYGFDLRTGALVKTFTLEGQTSTLKGLACAAFDNHDNIYVLDFTQGVFKINVDTGRQSLYAGPFQIGRASCRERV